MGALGNLVEAQEGKDMENMSEDDKKEFEKMMKAMWHDTVGDHDEELFNHLFDHEKDGEPTDDEIMEALGNMGMDEEAIHKSHEKFNELGKSLLFVSQSF